MNYKFIIKREIFSKTMANKNKKKIDNKNNEEKQTTVIYFE